MVLIVYVFVLNVCTVCNFCTFSYIHGISGNLAAAYWELAAHSAYDVL